MDADWIVLLLIHKFQALLLDQATIANPKLRIQVERATHKLQSIQENLKDNSRYDEQMARLLLAVYSVENATATCLTTTLLQRQKLSGSSQKCQNFTGLTYLMEPVFVQFSDQEVHGTDRKYCWL